MLRLKKGIVLTMMKTRQQISFLNNSHIRNRFLKDGTSGVVFALEMLKQMAAWLVKEKADAVPVLDSLSIPPPLNHIASLQTRLDQQIIAITNLQTLHNHNKLQSRTGSVTSGICPPSSQTNFLLIQDGQLLESY